MKYRRLTRDETEVPVLGLGTWPLGGAMGRMDDRSAIAVTRAAIDRGISLIDTARVYLQSERRLGLALKDGYRDRCFLATKVLGNYAPAAISAAIDTSLGKLDVDYVDLYQVHHPDPNFPFDETMEAMERLRQAGKTRYIGVSNYHVGHMRRAWKGASFHTCQPRYNMFYRTVERGVIPYCQDNGIGVLAHSPLAKGLLTGKYQLGHQFGRDDERSGLHRFRGETFAHYLAVADRLSRLASDKGITLVQLAIAWILRLTGVTCVLVGAKTVEQIEDHLGSVDVTFSQDELQLIETILKDTPAELYDAQ